MIQSRLELLFQAAGAVLTDKAVDLLQRRTEGWAAGLRLAALALAGHPDPECFAAEFTGNERTVVLRLGLAQRQGNLPAVTEQAEALLAAVEADDPASSGADDGLRSLALVSLGGAEVTARHFDGANRHLEQGILLARRIGRPYVELSGLVYEAQCAVAKSYTAGAEHSLRAIDLAAEHGWSDEPITAVALAVHADALTMQGRLEEAEIRLDHAQRVLRPDLYPVLEVNLRYVRASLELAYGNHAAAFATLEEVERLSDTLVTPHILHSVLRACKLHLLLRLGATQRVEQALTTMAADERDSTPMRTVEASLRLDQNDARTAWDVLAADTGGPRAGVRQVWQIAAWLLEAIASDALGRPDEAGDALERALRIAAPDNVLFPFLLHPAPDLLKRHAAGGTAYGALIREVLGRLTAAGEVDQDTVTPTPVEAGAGVGVGAGIGAGTQSRPGSRPRMAAHLREPLSGSETRVLRYLPTNLPAPEIAAQLSLSVNTVRTHMRHIYQKLGAHSRSEAVELARIRGLVASDAGLPHH